MIFIRCSFTIFLKAFLVLYLATGVLMVLYILNEYRLPGSLEKYIHVRGCYNTTSGKMQSCEAQEKEVMTVAHAQRLDMINVTETSQLEAEEDDLQNQTSKTLPFLPRRSFSTRAPVPADQTVPYKCRQYTNPFMPDESRADIYNNTIVFFDVYKPSKKVVNYLDFDFVISGEGICNSPQGSQDPVVLILVLCTILEQEERTTIRETWGTYAKGGNSPQTGSEDNRPIRIVFLFGKHKSMKEAQIVYSESKLYGDIVQADFVDSYYNLTLKVLVGMRWAALYCSTAQYLMKTDTDMFLHVPNLINFLQQPNITEDQPCGLILGFSCPNSKVLREGRWAVTTEEYPIDMYPIYLFGNAYLITMGVVPSMVEVAKHVKYQKNEDVFVTGVLRALLGIKYIGHRGFSEWYEELSLPCDFKGPYRLTATKMTPESMRQTWNDIMNGLSQC